MLDELNELTELDDLAELEGLELGDNVIAGNKVDVIQPKPVAQVQEPAAA